MSEHHAQDEPTQAQTVSWPKWNQPPRHPAGYTEPPVQGFGTGAGMAYAEAAPGYAMYIAPTPSPTGPNRRAKQAMVTGTTSLAFACVPIIGIVSWVLAPVGMAVSARALTDAEMTGHGKGQAMWGYAASLTSLLACMAWVNWLMGTTFGE